MEGHIVHTSTTDRDRVITTLVLVRVDIYITMSNSMYSYLYFPSESAKPFSQLSLLPLAFFVLSALVLSLNTSLPDTHLHPIRTQHT